MTSLQYIVLSDSKSGRLDMDGEYSFINSADALRSARKLHKLGYGISAIIALDVLTGAIFMPETRNRAQVENIMAQFDREQMEEEIDDRIYGSYEQQHILRTSDVIGRA